jgi:signal transduction histidine kinase
LVIVRIIDSGTGIDPEIKPRLFSKFSTTSDSGTGLGLYISKNIIEAHNGNIWADNNADGKGATFSFSLPLNDNAIAALIIKRDRLFAVSSLSLVPSFLG